MIHTVEVYLWGDRVGILYQPDGLTAPRFEYDADFQRSGIELAPFMMPLSDTVFSFPELMGSAAFHGLPGLVADSLPDRFGNDVIDLWLKQMGRGEGSLSPLERLCYTGKRGMGALEYVPANDIGSIKDPIDVTALTELAAEIISRKEMFSESMNNVTMAQMLDIGSSAGGARAKVLIAWNEDTNEVRSGQLSALPGFSQWLLKFDDIEGKGAQKTRERKQYTKVEYAYHLMAKDLKIEMSECRLMEKDGLSHFMTKRFDRVGDKKVFTQTLAALIHKDYNEPRTCSYETHVDVARRLGIGKSGVEEIFRRMVFNVLAFNCDDHVKNFSFVMDRQGNWSLSPAYDLTFAYNPNNYWLSAHQMSIGGKSQNLSDEDLLAFGKRVGLSSQFCKEVLIRTISVVRDWRSYAEQCGINDYTTNAIDSVLNPKIK